MHRQTYTNSGSHIMSAVPNWSPLLVPFYKLWIYMVGKKHSGKADQLSLASTDSEQTLLFSVVISWGNKRNFSLYANVGGCCSDGHTHMPTCMHACTHTRTHTNTHTHIHTHIHAHIHTHIHTLTHTHKCTHAHTNTHIYV